MKTQSRSERLSDAFQKISEAKSDIEELRDELQSWYDNLPENLQSSMKADALQEAIDNLETILDDLCELDGREADVIFPGMYS